MTDESTTITTVETGPVSSAKAAVIRWIGVVAIIAGALMIVTGGVTWGVVSSQLAAQKITVSSDASFLAGKKVTGPFSALAQADIIDKHAQKAAGGKTYAELKSDDPLRETVMTASFLRASLFTSVVSFGVAVFAIGAGLAIGVLGWAVFALAPRRVRRI